MIRAAVISSLLASAALAAHAQAPPAQPVAQTIPATAPPTIDARPWPRPYTVNGTEFYIYRPQLDSWSDNKLSARTVMAVKTGETKDKDGKAVPQLTYGVLWLNARTETDKEAREITLAGLQVERANFPAAKDREAAYVALARQIAPATDLVVSLDQVEASLALAASNASTPSIPVSNTPPEIIFSHAPGVLVLIDGEPVWKPAGVAGVQRVINTRALLLQDQGKYYLGYGGHWASAASLDGPWAKIDTVPASLEQVMQKAVAANEAPAAKDVPEDIAVDFKDGKFPAVYVRTRPTELISTDGPPEFTDIAGANLSFVSNTPADVFVQTGGNNNWYVLVSGRWFTAASDRGPWAYVAQNALPADFKKLPSDGPKSAVLASVAGTPESKEAMIANAIPQTATIDRTKVTFEPKYDGAPQFKPIEGTKLSYAVNSAHPVIEVPGASYYGLSNGIWFRSEVATGPWAVATVVPPAIYTIPASSPLHYVTYARVYGSSGNSVYVGYTPGYYGTVVSDSVVVYGSGYGCNAWVGEVWYGCPTTYGYGAAFAWGAAVGWGLSFGWGWYDPWYDPWWGPWYGSYPGYYAPWAYGGAVAGNVYGRWGNSVVAGTAAAWANPWTGNYGRAGAGGFNNTVTGGRGYGYAGRNTNAYTGTTTAAAGGIRYNPQTGRAVAGQGAAAGNIYSGNAGAAGSRTVVNTDTGRVTRQAGAAGRTDQGAGAVGGFNSQGARGDAAGAGYIHYDRASGDISSGGVANVGGDIYAGRDGNVYQKTDSGWEKAGADNRFSSTSRPDSSLNRDQLARSRGSERDFSRNSGFERGGPYSSGGHSFDRGSFGGGYSGRMGGGRSFGGGGRGGRR